MISTLSNLIAELSLRTKWHITWHLHVISARSVARDLHTVAPGLLERTCWRQFTALWGDCKKSRIAPLNAILLLLYYYYIQLSAWLFAPILLTLAIIWHRIARASESNFRLTALRSSLWIRMKFIKVLRHGDLINFIHLQRCRLASALGKSPKIAQNGRKVGRTFGSLGRTFYWRNGTSLSVLMILQRK